MRAYTQTPLSVKLCCHFITKIKFCQYSNYKCPSQKDFFSLLKPEIWARFIYQSFGGTPGKWEIGVETRAGKNNVKERTGSTGFPRLRSALYASFSTAIFPFS